MNKSSKLTIIPVMLCFFAMGFVDLVGIASNYVKEDLNLNDATANLFPSLVFFWFLIFSVPTGILMNKIGRKKTVLLSLLVTVISLLLPIFGESFGVMLVSFSLLGIGNALMQTSLNPLVSVVTTGKNLASTLTFGQFVKAIASFLAPYIAMWGAMASIPSFGLGWRVLFPIYMIIGIAATFFLAGTPIEEEKNEGKASVTVFFVALVSQLLPAHAAQLFQVGTQCGVQPFKQCCVAALGTAQGLRNHFFHDAIVVQVLCRQLHQLAGLAAAGGVLPQNAGKALGTQHRVDGIFQHEDMVRHAQRQRTAGGTFAGDDGNDRYGQAAHLHQIAGNGFALAALLGVLAGVRARRVDEGDDGPAKLFGLLHQAQGLAVAFRPGHAEVAGEIFFQCGALAVADDGHRHPVEPGHTAQDGGILFALAVAALLKKVGEQGRNHLVDVRALRVPSQKDPVLGG